MNTIEYLHKNGNDVVSGIHFTVNDLVFLKREQFDEIIINENKPTKEILNLEQIIERLEDLYKLAVATRAKSGVYNHEEYIENLEDVYSRLEKDFDVVINIK